ncbi:MAG: NAD(+)/NADH kinase [Candidatus Hermodarchaeota archaeon]
MIDVRSFKNIGIFSQVLYQETIDIINDILSIEENSSFSFFLNPELYDFFSNANPRASRNLQKSVLEDMPVDCIISIGGDGTILRVARTKPNIPILSINKGRKGFMTEIEPEDVIPSFKDFFDNKFIIEEHRCIEAIIDKKIIGIAINEIVITSVDLLKPIDFRLLVDEVITCGSLADGVIVATAVGSTGHSLSSGGCLIDPSLDNLEISWIDPINLSIRPIILASFRNIKLRCATRINPVKIVFDGQISLEYNPPIEVSFQPSKETVKFFRLKHFTSRWRNHLLPDIRE